MIKFRRAIASDAQDIIKLVNSAYRGETSKTGWTTEAHLLGGQRTDLDKILETVNKVDCQIELAVDEENEIIGCIQLEQRQDALYLGMLAVNPSLQAQGIGKILLSHSEEIARKRGISLIKMSVISLRPELTAYYQRRGYRPTGKTEPFPEHDPRFGLPRIKDLVFEEYFKLLV